jgi:hypothetical protein
MLSVNEMGHTRGVGVAATKFVFRLVFIAFVLVT